MTAPRHARKRENVVKRAWEWVLDWFREDARYPEPDLRMPQPDPDEDPDNPGADQRHDLAYYDSDGNQQLVTKSFNAVMDAWRDAGHKGSIIDLVTNEDLTPHGWEAFRMSEDELQALIDEVVTSSGYSTLYSPNATKVNPQWVQRIVEWLNGRPFKPLDIANLATSGQTKTVPLTKQREKTVIDVLPRPATRSKTKTHRRRQAVPYVADDFDLAPVSRARHLLDLANPTELVMPEDVLGTRYARKRLVRRTNVEETRETETKTWTVDVPTEVPRTEIESYTEEVEVPEDPQEQLLYAVVDWSGSMNGPSIHYAIAALMVIIGCHRKDKSRYFYSPFGTEMGPVLNGEGETGKLQLLQDVLSGRGTRDVGGGTDVLMAIKAAARTIRKSMKSGDHPEILLITDCDSGLTAEQVRAVLGDDITLHTVSVGYGSGRDSLMRNSTTFTQLDPEYGLAPSSIQDDPISFMYR